MKRFVQGEDRTQGTLLPELPDDYVAADNPDVSVDFGRARHVPSWGYGSGVKPATGGAYEILTKSHRYGLQNAREIDDVSASADFQRYPYRRGRNISVFSIQAITVVLTC